MIQISRRTIAYPGTNPGLNYSHPMARGISPGRGFSVVCTVGSGLLDLTTGKSNGIAGTKSVIKYGIGPTQNLNSTGNNFGFTNKSAANDTSMTMATIVNTGSTGVNGWAFVCNTGTANTGLSIVQPTGTGLGFNIGGGAGNVVTSLAAAANTSYFIACSIASAQTINVVLLNMQNGSIKTATVSAGTVAPATPNGTYAVGSIFGNWFGGFHAAAMLAPVYYGMGDLLKWANDPWAFWYPNRISIDVSTMANVVIAKNIRSYGFIMG